MTSNFTYYKKFILHLFFILSTGFCFSQNPNINVTGLSITIPDGDTTPIVGDNTDFGNIILGSNKSNTFNIQNTAGGSGNPTNNGLTVTSITLSGPHSSDFNITSIPSFIYRNEADDIFITFTPSAVGLRTATVTIVNNSIGSGEQPYTFDIQGMGVAPPPEMNILGNSNSIVNGDTTPDTSDDTEYGSVDIGSNLDHIFTIENTASVSTTLNLSGSPIVSISGDAAFSIITQPSSTTIIGGNTLNFTIRFSPISTNTVTADVSISNNDSDENPYTFRVKGTGLSPLTKGPGGITNNLHLWFKSNDGHSYSNGQSVTTWSSQGRGSSVTVDQAGREPTYYDNATRNINFNPVIEFDNTPSGPGLDPTFTAAGQQYLVGTDGFYTQEIFLVVMPDLPISGSGSTMDLFCGDDPLHEPAAEDVTGIGYGPYTASLTGEMVTYAQNVQTEYRIADNTGIMSYDNVGIVNARNNPSVNGMELFYNANNIETIEINTASFYNISNTNYWIGRSEIWGAGSNARFVEIINYTTRKNDASLTDERNKIQSYLGIKYGITLGVNGTSQDYVDSSGSVIWDQSDNIGFNYDVAGIGRDDDSELIQKQSKSVNSNFDGTGQTRGLLSIGLTDLYDTNNENIDNNTTTFNNREFLVWGNNNGNLDNAPNVVNVDMSDGIAGLSTPVTFTGMERIWRVSEINGDIPSVKISIPQNAIRNISPPGSYLMFISDTGVFDPTADYRVMTANGANLETYYDFDDTKYITFGYAPETIVERSVYFDGVNDYIDMEDALNLNSTEFTISAWIKRGASSGNTSIFSKRDPTYTEGYDFKVTSGGLIQLSWKNGGTQTITSDFIIPQNEWHQVAVIFNSGTAKLYIDGILNKTVNSLNNPTDTNQSFFIAAAGKTAPTSLFEGNIDEVRVWDVALSVDQLRYLMNQELEKNTTFVNGTVLHKNVTKNEVATLPWSNLAGYYPMSVYTYTNTNDESDNNNQGALRNLDTVDHQTAPLPYKSENNGSWDTNSTWLNNSVQYLPNTTVNGTVVDWNIVETYHNINTTRGVKLLALKNHTNEISVNPDNLLEITHYLKLDGVLDLDGESQLIQTLNSDFDDASTGYLERDQQGEGNLFRYNDWSSPVIKTNTVNGSSFAIADVLRDGTNASTPGTITYSSGYDGATSPMTLSTNWMFKYANLTSNTYSAWQHISNTGAINPGEGFIMKGTGAASDQNYVFEGKPNNGIINLTINSGNDYLVGNPYPSAIDANKFISDNTGVITGVLYFWEHWGNDSHILSEYQAGYGTYNLSGGLIGASGTSHPDVDQTGSGTKIPQRYIPVAQGFFVVAQTGGTIEFNNSQRIFITESSGSSIFMKGSKSKNKKLNTSNNIEQDLRPKIRIGFDAPKIDHRQLLLTVDKNTTDDVDWGYDAEIFEIFNDDMYWMINDKKFVIQGINEINLEKEIPIGIETLEGGNVRIMIDKLENFDKNSELFIKDLQTGETYNISDNPFEIYLEAGEYFERFVLAFQPRLKTIEEIELIEGINVYMDNSTAKLQIKKIIDVNIEKIDLFNILGQKIKEWNSNLLGRRISLPVSVNSGAYIVNVKTTEGNISKKIIIK